MAADADFDKLSFFHAEHLGCYFYGELLEALLPLLNVERFPTETLLVSAEVKNDLVYFLISGSIQIIVEGEHLYSMTAPGDVFSVINVSTHAGCVGKIVSETEVEALVFKNQALETLPPSMAAEFRFHLFQLTAATLVSTLKTTTTKAEHLERMNLALNKDSLTGCWNQNKFFYDLPFKKHPVLLYLKIDKFNEINDGLGFEAGNIVLAQVSQIMRGLLLPGAELYRFSGSEFGILLEGSGDDGFQLSETIKKEVIFSNITYRNSRVVLTLSVGIADHHSKDIFKNAHLALGEAKKTGKTVVYTEELNAQIQYVENLQQFKTVQEGFENNLFYPVFQGIRDNRKDKPYYGEIRKYECLMRLRAGDKEISPYFFLKALERSGEITRATKLMIMKSFDHMIRNEYEFSINFTEKDLLDDSMLDFIQYELEGNKIKPQRVTFEILEGVGSLDSQKTSKMLHDLRRLGCKIAIDDFGAEQSNISRLLDFEPDYIKIDAKFIKNLPSDKKSRIIVENVYDLAARMGAEVIAEFVANQEIQHIVEEIGIHFSQGYLFSQPKPHTP